MRLLNRYLAITPLLFAISALPVQAHLMVAGHGTLNIVDGNAFMVLSLPVSAFPGLDDDKDGEVSMIEFNRHRSDIIDSIGQNVVLRGNLPLQGVMLSPVVPHDVARESISNLTVMGRFPLSNPSGPIHFFVGLYGEQAVEQSLEITATRAVDNQKTVFQLNAGTPARKIFTGPAYAPILGSTAAHLYE